MNVAPSQLTLDFEPSLVERHPTLLACVRSGAYSAARPLKALAADMDMSQSELSRKLNPGDADPRRMSLDDLEAYLQATGDTTPIRYLVAKYMSNPDDTRAAALAALASMLPDLQALVRQAAAQSPRKP